MPAGRRLDQAGERRETAFDRSRQRPCARQRPLMEHRGCQPCALALGTYGGDVAFDERVHSQFLRAGANEDRMHLPRCAAADVGAAPAEDQQLVAGLTAPAQRCERSRVAAVRRRGQQHHVAGAGGQGGNRPLAVAVARSRMRFVDNHDIPRCIQQRRENVRPLDEVDRGHDD